jgi:predicted RNA binding protein YcfA (HicA-like mRNA interferase family)
MKRADLVRHLGEHGCQLLREGGRHSIYWNPANRKTSAVPRHNEMQRTPPAQALVRRR